MRKIETTNALGIRQEAFASSFRLLLVFEKFKLNFNPVVARRGAARREGVKWPRTASVGDEKTRGPFILPYSKKE